MKIEVDETGCYMYAARLRWPSVAQSTAVEPCSKNNATFGGFELQLGISIGCQRSQRLLQRYRARGSDSESHVLRVRWIEVFTTELYVPSNFGSPAFRQVKTPA